jgi:hypothetical protein
MQNNYRRIALHKLAEFQQMMADLYVHTPIETNTFSEVPVFKTRQPEEFYYSLTSWEPAQLLAGNNTIHPAYFQIFGLPQQDYPIVEISKETKQHVANQRANLQLRIWHHLRVTLFIPVAGCDDMVLELYNDADELVETLPFTTCIMLNDDLKIKTVVNNPAGSWYVAINFLSQQMWGARHGNTVIEHMNRPMCPVAVTLPPDQILPD